jgi:hypothetical protein
VILFFVGSELARAVFQSASKLADLQNQIFRINLRKYLHRSGFAGL